MQLNCNFIAKEICCIGFDGFILCLEIDDNYTDVFAVYKKSLNCKSYKYLDGKCIVLKLIKLSIEKHKKETNKQKQYRLRFNWYILH